MDYYNTNYPVAIPTFPAVTTTSTWIPPLTAISIFAISHYHELQCWNVPGFIRIEAAPTFVELLEKLTAFLGRQPELPEWGL